MKNLAMMASLDICRPAAQEQLITLGQENKIDTLSIQENKSPLQIAKDAKNRFTIKLRCIDNGYAGRNQEIQMMKEIKEISESQPFRILLVSDSMTGQDAVNTAQTFSKS